MFSAIGRFSVRNRYWVIGFWALLVILGGLLAPSIDEFGMSTGFLAPGVESVDALHLMDKKFGRGVETGSIATVVIYNPSGLTEADERFADQSTEMLRSGSVGGVVSVTNPLEQPELRSTLISLDKQAMLIPVGMDGERFDASTAAAIDTIRKDLPAPPPGTTVYVSGDAAIGGDHIQACLDAFNTTAIAALILITVILLLVYRSPVAPLVSLFTIGIAAAVSMGLFGFLMERGVNISSFVPQFMILIIFGAGTDYCLFIVSRYREELARGKTREEAAIVAMSRIGVVIASAAAVVIAGFFAMYFAQFEMFKLIGPPIAAGVAILLLAALTFTPAIMSAVRPSILFWPVRSPATPQEASSGFWGRVGRLTANSPAAVLLVALVLLALPMYKLGSFNRTFEIIKDMPATYESIAGYEVVESRFDLSQMFPVYVLVDGQENLRSEPGIAAMFQLSDGLSSLPGVAVVRSVTQPQGQRLSLPPAAVLSSPEMQPLVDYFVSADGSTARFMLGLNTDPYANEAVSTIRQVRAQGPSLLEASGLSGSTMLVAGASAEMADMRKAVDDDFVRVVVLVSLAVLVLLALLLRSLVAPIYLLATIFLTYLTTLGISAIVFQDIVDFRFPGVDWTVPLMLFILLVVLATDYSILLMSRIKEESHEHGLRDGVERGVAHTGGVISSAGLILAGTLGVLMLAPLGSLIQMGFAIAFGVLLDAFLVRPFVQPAIARLLGRWGWWPGELSRRTTTE